MAKIIQQFHLEYQGEDVGVTLGLVGKPDKDIILKLIER